MARSRTEALVLLGRCALVSALSAGFSAHAATPEDDLFFSELPMVASVSRLPQKLSEAPGSVTVIDQEMIRASGVRYVSDLLRLVPGFQVTSANQDPAVVAYHGLNTGLNSDEYGPRVQVLIDGRSQYSPLFKSGVNWSLLPVALENIERIEVIRGSNTVAYGSNAAMGVINIITMDASQTKGWMLAAHRGNDGIGDETLRWGGKVGDADIRFTYQRTEDDAFQNALYSGIWNDAIDSVRNRLLDLRVDLPLTNRDELQLSASQATNVSQYGRPGSPLNDPIRNLQQRSTSLGLQWRHVVSDDEEFKLRYAYNEDWATGPYVEWVRFDTNLASPKTTIFSNMFDPGGKSIVHELELQHVLAPLTATRLMWGAAIKSIDLYSPAQFSTTDWKHRTSYRVFGNLEYRPLNELLFNLGASAEHDSVSGWMFDPRASVSYHVLPDHTLRFVASQAHRSPSLYEAQGSVIKAPSDGGPFDRVYLAVPDLKPEKIDTLELGYLGELKSARASIDVRAFREHIPNRIQIVPLPLPANAWDNRESTSLRNLWINNAIYPYGRADGAINLENVLIKGYEYQLRWQPLEGTRLIYNSALVTIDANLTDELLVADDHTSENILKISRQTRESAPTRSQSAMLIQRLPYDVQASIMYFRSGAMRWRRNGDPIQPSERYDWRLAKAFRLGTNRAEVAYTVQMANTSQEGRQTARVADQMHWLSLRLDF